MKKKFLAFFVLVSVSVLSMVGIVLNVQNTNAKKPNDYAEFTDEYIKKRIAYLALNYCYNNKAKSEISYEGFTLDDYNDNQYVVFGKKTSIFNSGSFTSFPSNNTFFGFDKIECANNSSDRNKANFIMRVLANVNSKVAGVTDIKSTDVAARSAFYKGMGYEPQASGDTIKGAKCYKLNYSVSYDNKYVTNGICFSYNDKNEIVGVYNAGIPPTPGTSGHSFRGAFLRARINGEIADSSTYIGRYSHIYYPDAIDSYPCSGDAVAVLKIVYDLGEHEYDAASANTGCLHKISDLEDAMKGLMADANAGFIDGYSGVSQIENLDTHFQVESVASFTDNSKASTEMSDKYVKVANPIATATQYLEDTTENWRFPWESEELYYIYLKYLFNVYGAKTVLSTCTSEVKSGDDVVPIVMLPDGSDKKVMQYCNVDNYNGIKASKNKIKVEQSMTEKKLTYDDFVNNYLKKEASKITAVTITRIPAQNAVVEEVDPNIGPQPGDDQNSIVDDGSANQDPCWNSGIDSMAWIMCPTENNLKTVASGLSGELDKMLQMDSSLYSNDSGAHTAWEYMRTIANTLMIIVLGAIIFSQLTGYGIDNYGIKKILPKFIVMAVLINLSFFACQLVIDLSNIIGNGIQGLFYGIGNGIIDSSIATVPSARTGMSNFIDGLVTAFYAAFSASPVAIGVVSTASSGGGVMAVVLILLMLLTILVAILVFFISLGARVVIIIMCSVLAPLALACYILPNTKPMYKKWYEAMKAAVLIYPICGAMIGISYVIKAIAVTTSEPSWPFLLISGVAAWIPFFMVPTLLRGAINALGVVGSVLGSMGSSFKSYAGKAADSGSKAIQGTNTYKSAQAEMARKRQAGYATRLRKRLDKKEDSGKKLSTSEQRMRAYAQQTLDKQNSEDVAALQSAFSNKKYATSGLDVIGSDLEKELADYKNAKNDAERIEKQNNINALTNLMVARGGASAAGGIAKAINGAGLSANDGAYQVLRDNMSANRDFGTIMKSKRGGSMYDKISSLGNGTMAESMANGSLSSSKDWTTQSASEVSAAAREAERIRKLGDSANDTEKKALKNFDEITKQLVSSDDPNIRTNVLGDPDKRNAWINAASKIPGYNAPSSLSGQANNSGTFNVGSARAGDQFEVSLREADRQELPKGSTEFTVHEFTDPGVGSVRASSQYETGSNAEGKQQLRKGTTEFRPHEYQESKPE